MNDVQVSTDFTTTLDIAMVEGSVELDAVVIQAERTPLIRQDLTNPVASISSEAIEALPITDISEVIGLQAGVTVDDDGTIHIRGGLGNEIAYTVNGININNPYSNRSSLGVATNAVREVSVSSGTFSAEYGSALSGVVNYVTRDGGPKLSGSAKYYTGDHVSSHKDLFFNINKITPSEREPHRGNARWADPRRESLVLRIGRVQLEWRASLRPADLPPHGCLPLARGFPSGDPRRGSTSAPYYFAPLSHDTSNRVGGPAATVPSSPGLEQVVQSPGNVSWHLTSEMKLKYEFVYNFSEEPDYGTVFHPCTQV